MGLLASEGDSGGPKQKAPAGTHVARCISVIDLGTQAGEYQGKANLRHKLRIAWELPDEKAVFKEEDGEQPFVVAKTYTLSLGEKASLRHDLESWRGRAFTEQELKGFDIKNLLDVPCLLSIIHVTKGEKTYANVQTITKLAKGMVCPPRITPLVRYEVEEGRNQTWQSFPEWLQKQIAECKEWQDQPEQEPDYPEERPGTEEENEPLPF